MKNCAPVQWYHVLGYFDKATDISSVLRVESSRQHSMKTPNLK